MIRATNIISFGAFAFLTACSSYQGHKVAADGTLPPGVRTGIPFQMTRPEYSLNISPSADDPTVPEYSLVATHVPDNSNRYTLTLDPAIFADSTFLLKFGSFGNISQNTSGLTSRAVATFEAIASGVSQLAAMRDESTALDNYRNAIRSSADDACARPHPINSGLNVKTQIDNEMSTLAQLGMAATPDKADAGAKYIFRYYHPIDIYQLRCLQVIKKSLEGQALKDEQTIKDSYDKALKPIEATLYGKKIAAFVEKSDISGLANLISNLSNEVSDPQNGEDASVAFGVAQHGKSLLDIRNDQTTKIKLAAKFSDMVPRVWRARHLYYLERRIAELRTELMGIPIAMRLSDPTAASLQVEITSAMRDSRSLLESDELIQRLDNLNKFLNEVRTTYGEKGLPPRIGAEEYTKIRAERDLLEAKISQLRLNVLAGNDFDENPGKPKIQEKTGIPVSVRDKEFISQVNNQSGNMPDLPPYVLILELAAPGR